MIIDLNDPLGLTVENVRKLIESGDDRANSQLCVNKAGIAFLVNTLGSQQPADLAFRIETWIAGRGYVGNVASRDDDWVEQVYKALSSNWPNPTAECIDLF